MKFIEILSFFRKWFFKVTYLSSLWNPKMKLLWYISLWLTPILYQSWRCVLTLAEKQRYCKVRVNLRSKVRPLRITWYISMILFTVKKKYWLEISVYQLAIIFCQLISLNWVFFINFVCYNVFCYKAFYDTFMSWQEVGTLFLLPVFFWRYFLYYEVIRKKYFVFLYFSLNNNGFLSS